MRGSAAIVSVCVLALAFGGCSGKKKDAAASQDYGAGYQDPYSNYNSTPTASQPAALTASDPYASTGAYASGGRYHVVAKKDTLYSLARQYYGDAKKWREIYEANRSEIGDPNRIKVGQRLLIP